MNVQPMIAALTVEIDKLTAARDALQNLNGASPKTKAKKKAPTVSPETRKKLAASMRRRWAEQKRKQRAVKTRPASNGS